jgi:Protein of unknown function (DUF2934)
MSRKPSREEVEIRAYEIYLERGQEHGHDVDHWLAAEQELVGTPQSEPERDPRTVTRPTPPTTSQAPQQRSAVAGASSSSNPSSPLNPRGKS